MKKELQKFIKYLQTTPLLDLAESFEINYTWQAYHNTNIANHYLYHLDMTGFQRGAKYIAYYEDEGLYIKVGNYGHVPMGRSLQNKLYRLFEIYNISIRNRIIHEQKKT